MKTNFLHTCLFACLSFLVAGQELRFQNFTMEDGFAHIGTDYSNSILKDREGFVWFATFNGLSRFDGESFKNYKYDPANAQSIGGNLLTSLGEDAEGRIWIGTVNRGIYIFDKEKQAFSTFSSSDEAVQFTLKATILFIEKDKDGNMWFGGDNGVGYWNPQIGRAEQVGPRFENAYCFFQQPSGTIWMADTHGLHRRLPDREGFEIIPLPDEVGLITDIVALQNGNLGVATVPGKLWELNPATLVCQDMLPDVPFRATNLVAGNNGDIWMANGKGIMRYNQNTGSKNVYQHAPRDPLSLPDALLTDIFVDESDNLFISTRDKGVVLAHAQPNPFEVIAELNCLESIMLDDHRLLIRDFERGGIVYDTRKKIFTGEKLPVGPGSFFLPSLAMRGDSLLWIWSNREIKSYHLRTGKTTIAPPNPAFSLYVNIDQKGRVWNGLSYLDENKGQWVNIYPDLQAILPALTTIKFTYACILFDEKNHLWAMVNGHNRTIRYDLEAKKVKEYNIDGIPNKGTDGRIYLQSPEGLGVFLPEKDSFMLMTEKEGLMHSMAYHTLDDASGNTWIGTPKGLQQYNWTTGTSTIIDYRDGFPAAGHTLIRVGVMDADGFIYNTINMEKVFRFHPDSIQPNTERAPVYLLDFYLDMDIVEPAVESPVLQKKLRFTDRIHLAYNQADFGFSFTMPVYYKSDKIEYFYRLEPFQSEWYANGTSNEVQFTNISPGYYTFRVKAKTASGQWSTGEASVEIFISPPWWKTWWACILYAFLLFLTVYAVYRFNLRRQFEKQEAFRLKEMDILKSRLYTNITHEFRTPLTVIMGVADNLRGNQQERNLIRRNSKNLLRLINQLLDLSKLDSGTMKMDMVQGDIINYLRYLTESFYSMAQEKKVGLEFSTEVDELEMDFDEVKIQHVIYNLLSNALKFTQENGQVQINASKKTRNGQPFLQIKVQDTGMGISAEQLPHIFDRFYQADNSTTRKEEGTGIGLALTRELVQLMGGTVGVKSKLGEGTLFTILLPVKKDATTSLPEREFTTARTLAPELVPDVSTGYSGPPVPDELPQLLLIEDNRDVATYIQSLLKNRYHVSIASDGQQGIDQALEVIPDLIITDVMMPEKDGYEVCETLKQDERTSHIPIVMLTAKAEQKDKVTGLKHGADAYLLKPFDKEELFVRLEKLLDLRRALMEKYNSGLFSASQPVPSLTEPTIEDKFLQALREAAEKVMAEPETAIANLEKSMHLSQMQLYRKLKALTGLSPSVFLRNVRLQKARQLLKSTDLTVSEIAYEVGFSSPAYFSRAFSEKFGQSPTDFRN